MGALREGAVRADGNQGPKAFGEEAPSVGLYWASRPLEATGELLPAGAVLCL